MSGTRKDSCPGEQIVEGIIDFTLRLYTHYFRLPQFLW